MLLLFNRCRVSAGKDDSSEDGWWWWLHNNVMLLNYLKMVKIVNFYYIYFATIKTFVMVAA